MNITNIDDKAEIMKKFSWLYDHDKYKAGVAAGTIFALAMEPEDLDHHLTLKNKKKQPA